MHDIIAHIITWSEVWALLIPMAIIIFRKVAGPGMRPLVLYVWIAFILNTTATIISLYNDSMPSFLKNNNLLYNLHSLARVLLFSWYLFSLKLIRLDAISKIILPVYTTLVLINFIFFEDPFFLSSRLFSAESIVLLVLCLYFFMSSMRDESDTNWLRHTSFLVCTGICIYESINFFIFLFYYVLENNPDFGLLTMKIYSISYVILCILLAVALYRNSKKLKTTAQN